MTSLFSDGTAPATIGEGSLHVVVLGAATPRSFELPRSGSFVLGRSEGCDARVDDPSVSRRHAMIHVSEGLTITDLDSANGITLRGTRLKPREPASFAIGEPIELGSALLVVHRRRTATSRTIDTADGASTSASSDTPMRRLLCMLDRVARSDLPVLLTGETGCGKEVMATRLHAGSPRAGGPFVRINCAAIAPTVAESELFGHERGAFTGATQARVGLIESANGGTLFLDEIGDMPMSIQTGILRVIEQREVLPVGALRPRPVDVRFVSATHRDLHRAIEERVFREDLYYRLNGITLAIPPLRERMSEVRALATHFLSELARRPVEPHPSFFEALERHDWPGNVRELRNVVSRAWVLADGATPSVEHVVLAAPPTEPAARPSVPDASPPGPTDERARIERALRECGGNQSRAADVLGISRRTLLKRLDAYDLPRPLKSQRR